MTYTRTHVHPAYGTEVAEHGVTPPDDCVELSDEVCIRPTFHWRSDRGETEADRRLVGYVVAHDVDGQEVRCEGALMLEPGFGPPVWTQTGSLEHGDLSLAPSVQCKTHGAAHGFVRRGGWVPA